MYSIQSELRSNAGRRRFAIAVSTAMALVGTLAQAATDAPAVVEAYVPVPMPPGFSVASSELDGPVFADPQGRTLYTWPMKPMRNGQSGEPKGIPGCYDVVLKETAGLMSPYPPGLELPDLDTRPSCTDLWPPVLAEAGAAPVGKWSLVERKDGTTQWAYDEQPLYTSRQDRELGDVIGGTTRQFGGDSPALRVAAGPPSRVPPGFAVKSTALGRLLTTDKNFSVYTYDKDTAQKSLCDEQCAKTWQPLLAPLLARPQGEWSVVERSAGVLQWAFRGKPLYTYTLDMSQWGLDGSDVPGWHNVYMQPAPPLPAHFTVQDTLLGQVLADEHGKTIYQYRCGDDSQDQLSCDHPDDTQVYRIVICGAGDVQRCLKNWPYVPAAADAKATSRSWSILEIDPTTGRLAAGQPGAIRVWAFRDRPVYTYSGDHQAGDIFGDAIGEWRSQRNGFKAIWLRDDHFSGDL